MGNLLYAGKVNGEALQDAIAARINTQVNSSIMLSAELRYKEHDKNAVEALDFVRTTINFELEHLMEILKAGGDNDFIRKMQKQIDEIPAMIQTVLASDVPLDYLERIEEMKLFANKPKP